MSTETTTLELRADTRCGSIDRLLLLLITFTPAIFALVTWNPAWTEGDATLQGILRRLSIPVLIIELLTVIFALTRGFEPTRAVLSSTRWMRATLGLLILIAFGTAAFVAPNSPLALFRTCIWLLHLLFALATAYLLATHWSGLRSCLWPSIVAGTCAYSLIVPFFVAAVPNPQTFDWGHFGLGVVNVRQIGFYSTVGATAALGFAFYATGRKPWLFWLMAASMMQALSLWSGTRSSVVAITAAFGIGLILLPSMRSARALVSFAVSNLAGAALSLLYAAPSPLFGIARMWTSVNLEGANAISSNRIEMWSGTIRAIGARPLFGYGESQFRAIVPEALGIYNHPHNSILQVTMQWGLIGASCFLALAGSLWWRMYVVTRHRPGQMAPAFLIANGLLIFSLYEGALYHPYPIMMIALAVAFVLGSNTHLNPASPQSPAPSATATATARPR